MRKDVDKRVRKLMESGVRNRHQFLFVVIGDKYYNTIFHLHQMFKDTVTKARPSVLWCYKNKLELSRLRRGSKRRSLDTEEAKKISLFVESISHCQYRDSEKKYLGTHMTCVLQDFEALTPNILARTIETVEGGGLVVILVHSLSTLTSLYTMVMDVHEKFRTESHSEIVSLFNERFLLSLSSCKTCLVMDDEFNILPIFSKMKFITQSTAEVQWDN